LVHKYADAFATPDGQLGGTDLVKHSIDTGNARPIKTPYRPPTFAKRAIIDENLDKMLENDIIEPSNSPWASPVVLTKKKDGTHRFCVDLRKLNDVTRKDAYPLPNIQDCLSSLEGAKWFCTLDLASGYWKVAMEESDKEKTAFATHRGLFQFKKMAFGLTNAPATFMRLMERVLQRLNWEQCLVYLDDIIVFGDSFDQCLSRLQTVIQRIQDAGLKLKPSKCHLFRSEVSFLGHIVKEEGIACDPEKIVKVREWPTPESVGDVRSFLGLANYYKRFIQGFSSLALPLTEMTGKNKTFRWDERCQTSFESLKDALTTAPVLAYPSSNPDDIFILDTDASNFGIGAVLSQMQDGAERVIAYASKGLGKSERNYCTTFRELLAVVVFITHFKPPPAYNYVHVREDFPAEMEEERSKLFTIARAAQKVNVPGSQAPPKIKLNNNKLYINDQKVTASSMHQLPENLQPRNIYTPMSSTIAAYYTDQSPLSNHFPANFTVDGEKYNCVEQFITVQKARIRSMTQKLPPM
jgi:hypothetical protein